LSDASEEPRPFRDRAAPVLPLGLVRDRPRVRGEQQVDERAGVGGRIELAEGHTRHMVAAILTIGNEIVSGDIENGNASWLGRRLEQLGVKVVLSAAVPDELDPIISFVRRESQAVDHLIVTGGLGGTPDDITREALAAAYAVPQQIVPWLADDL